MERIELYNIYYNKDFETFIKKFNEYIKNGYGIEDTLVGCYIHALIATKKYEKAYKILKMLEKDVKKFDTYEDLARLYVKCFKPKDAERMINLKKTPINDYLNLVKIKLLEGKVEEAEKILNTCMKNEIDPKHLRRLRSYERLIINHQEKGAYIETEYECFKENGNKLEPGHIVFLKDLPKSNIKWHDAKAIDRPYMIWKIEKENIYLFPVSTRERKKAYKLFMQKYPNSTSDRTIKYTPCYTTEDNILTVRDKVLDEDFKVIIDNLYQEKCISSEHFKLQNIYPLQEYIDTIWKYDIIMNIDQNKNRKIKNYLVLDVEDEYYRVIEIDLKEKRVIGLESKVINKDRIIYDVIRLKKNDLEKLIEQLREQVKLKTLVGKKATANDIRYIVVDEDKEYYLCIDEIYSTSYINVEAVPKSEFETITGEITKEELKHIKTLIEQNGYNIKKYLIRQRKN